MANSLWTFLNTDIKDLFSLDTVNEAADATGAVMALAETLEDEDIQDLAPWVEQSASLLDVLNSPEADLIESLLPFAKIATGLLKFYLTKSKQPLSFPDCVVLVGLKAYSESLRGFLVTYTAENQPILVNPKSSTAPPSSKLKDFELSEAEAKQTLLCFHRSPLATHLNTLMCDRLQRAGLPESDAQRLCDRSTWNTHRYITKAWNELPEEKGRFSAVSLAEWREEQEKYDSIAAYLNEKIAPLPKEQVFDEQDPIICFQNIYVPLNVQPLNQDGEELSDTGPINSHEWAQTLLEQPAEPRKVMFVQGEAGRGKSVFCRMFADWVRQEMGGAYIPILIRLRHLRKLANNLTETLENCPDLEQVQFVKGYSDWISNRNTRFLIILDGFDELLLEESTTGGLKEFLQQVADFQARSHHQCLVTGRPLALQGVDRLITQTKNLERVRLEPMDDDLREQWLYNWQQILRGTEVEVSQFREVLDACPNEITNTLAREPLLLYLLARLHREGHLNGEMFADTQSQAKLRVYQASVSWVLEKQRQDENLSLAGLNNLEDLREVLRETALCVLQSGNETARLNMLKERFQNTANPIADLLKQSQDVTGLSLDRALNNLLTTFYLKPGEEDRRGSVEFAHRSFGEYLFAERLKIAFEDWSRVLDRGGRQLPLLDDNMLNWQIYDLLGYGGLSIEIVEYLFELLSESELNRVELFKRLHKFYQQWCNREFLNHPPTENLPMKKMVQLSTQNISIGLQEVDVFAGLNVLIALFKLHVDTQSDEYQNLPDHTRKPDIWFHPCGEPETDKFEEDRLLKIIYYTEALGFGTFTKLVGPHLSSVNLSSANLSSVNLSRANLSSVNLSRADLSSATLDNANLSSANLRDANLDSTYLYGANLSGANLYSANLFSANLDSANLDSTTLYRVTLYSANLYNTILSSANLSSANLSSANLDSANLSNANLSSANLDSANLESANLSSANLESANLSSANLSSADLSRANLSSTIIYSANLSSVTLYSANLSSATLYNTTLSSAILSNALLIKTDFREVKGLKYHQFEEQNPPLICGAIFPPGIVDNKDRDCDLLPSILYKRYPKKFETLEQAQEFVNRQQQPEN